MESQQRKICFDFKRSIFGEYFFSYNLKYNDFVLFTASDVVVDWAKQVSIISIGIVIVAASVSVIVVYPQN